MTDAPDTEGQPDPKRVLTTAEVAAELLEDWAVLLRTLGGCFLTGGFQKGLPLVAAIGEIAEEMNHHPDVDLRYGAVHVRATSHDVGGITSRDVELARRVSEAAGRLGAEPDLARVQSLELALDTPDHARVKDFWAALLGMRPTRDVDDEVSDPSGVLPTLWFQQTDPHEAPRQRFHLDITVPADLAEGRVRAALEAGGTLVSDERAPAFWVLADADGNRACVCTALGRDN
ncbi:VOC family protein [Nocardioides sp. GCM10027113]|uniref:VOC family protein n=1 Tax=unclassified Nocardioides TaxID=2615069 RepID=UPI00360811FA